MARSPASTACAALMPSPETGWQKKGYGRARGGEVLGGGVGEGRWGEMRGRSEGWGRRDAGKCFDEGLGGGHLQGDVLVLWLLRRPLKTCHHPVHAWGNPIAHPLYPIHTLSSPHHASSARKTSQTDHHACTPDGGEGTCALTGQNTHKTAHPTGSLGNRTSALLQTPKSQNLSLIPQLTHPQDSLLELST